MSMGKERQPAPDSQSFFRKAKRKALVAGRIVVAGVAVGGFGTGAVEHYHIIPGIENTASNQAIAAGKPEIPGQEVEAARATVTAFEDEINQNLKDKEFGQLLKAAERAAADADAAQSVIVQQEEHESLEAQNANELGRRRANCIQAESMGVGILAIAAYALGPIRRFKRAFQ